MTTSYPLVDGPAAMVADRRAAIIRWARHTLICDAAVVAIASSDMYLSVRAVCEIAVIDAAGHNLLDTLVNPQIPVTAAARRFHRPSDGTLACAPTFCTVLPELLAVSGEAHPRRISPELRQIGQLRRMRQGRYGSHHLEDEQTWRAISKARSVSLGHPGHHLPLDGGPRALGAAHAALQDLSDIAARDTGERS